MNILFIGASGYGNVGDEAYKYVVEDQLKFNEILFESPYPSEASIIWADYVVFGGGGIVYVNETSHFDYYKMYYDWCVEHKKPYSFFSVGVQVRKKDYFFGGELPEDYKKWSPILKGARSISVRSDECKKKINWLGADCEVFPDAVYGLTPQRYKIRTSEKKMCTIIPTPSTLKAQKKEYEEVFKTLHQEDCDISVLSFSESDLEAGKEVEQEFSYHEGVLWRRHITPREALSVLKESSSVLTGRYHGHVLARVAGIPENEIIVVDKRYKSVVEKKHDRETLVEDSKKHIEHLKKFLFL